MKKNIFLEKKTKVALGPGMWVAAYIRGPKHVYAGTLLCMQLRFQKHEKGKFFAIMAEVWNESHIIWQRFQTPFLPLFKALHGIFSKCIEIPGEKYKIHQKIVNQKGVFYKTPSSQFCLIETFFGPNPSSLMLLLIFLLVCEQI